MKVVDEEHLGKAITNVLGRVEINLVEPSSQGRVLDYGGNVKEYVHSFDTWFTKLPINLGNGRHLYYDYYNVTLPSTINPRSVIALSANIEGSDELLNKVATVKHLSGRTFRIDYSGNARMNNLPDNDKNCKISFRILMNV